MILLKLLPCHIDRPVQVIQIISVKIAFKENNEFILCNKGATFVHFLDISSFRDHFSLEEKSNHCGKF